MPVGLHAGIGPTARPRPIAVADSPIEAATPDPQHPLCYLYYSSHGGLTVLTSHHSSTPGQLLDRPVGLGRRADAGTGRTARPLPIAVADVPIEAATPDPQHPMSRAVLLVTVLSSSKLHYSSTPGQLPDRPVGLGRRVDAGIGPTARPESGDFSYGRRRTEPFGHWDLSTSTH